MSRLARFALLLYPPSFRREMGEALVDDVRRRAAEHTRGGSRLRRAARLLRLLASLLLNAPAAWLEALGPRRNRASRRRTTNFSWLDVKLGLRMLLKHPGLTLAGGLGIAVAIGVSTGFFAFMYTVLHPTVPLDEGHRLVALQNWDLEHDRSEPRSLHDFVLWRNEMRSVEDVTAFRTVPRNLIRGDASPELVDVAEMTPSGFELARVPPLMGRTLVAADAEPGAADVLVIGYDVWRTRFAADPEIVGREVRLGRVAHTVVGVMPEGFAFPVNHGFWTPLRADPADHPRGGGPAISISGRLAPGYSLEDAKAELRVIGERMAAEHPDTHARLLARVMPYTYPWSDLGHIAAEDIGVEMLLVNSFISLLLMVVGMNVAILIYARTATRRGEIAVRTALGASRARIVGQLFAESLVLAAVAAVVGVGLARVGLGIGYDFQTTELATIPFWVDLQIPGPAVAYAVLLAVVAAAITGILPGLQATSKRVHQNLRQHHGGAGLRLGRTWTTLIVLQVTVTVAVMPIGVAFGCGEIARLTRTPTYPVDRFLVARVFPDAGGVPREEADELAGVRSELMRRMEAEPGVAAVMPVLDLPNRGLRVRVVVEGGARGAASDDPGWARSPRVHPDLLAALELEVLAGRPLLPADREVGAADVVVVDHRFVRHVLGGGQALGRRIRFTDASTGAPTVEGTERWFEVVGVVEDLHASRGDDVLLDPQVYRPMGAGSDYGGGLLLKAAGVDLAALAARVRQITADIDPTFRVVSTDPLTDTYRFEQLTVSLTALLVLFPGASVLLLSAAGIYALMSFTVSQRRREIGIRMALGAERGRLLGGVFKRALGQLSVGVGLGVAAAVAWDWGAGGQALQGHGVLFVGSMVVLMVCVGLLAAVGPARRGVGVQPTEALQAE